MPGYYYRADRRGQRVWARKPGRYGLFLVPTDRVPLRIDPEDMVESADSVDALVAARRAYKPDIPAVIIRSQLIDCFEEEIRRERDARNAASAPLV